MQLYRKHFKKQYDALYKSRIYINGDVDQVIDIALASMDEYNCLPSSFSYWFPYLEIVNEVVDVFKTGATTAEQASSELQTKITLKMNE